MSVESQLHTPGVWSRVLGESSGVCLQRIILLNKKKKWVETVLMWVVSHVLQND